MDKLWIKVDGSHIVYRQLGHTQPLLGGPNQKKRKKQKIVGCYYYSRY